MEKPIEILELEKIYNVELRHSEEVYKTRNSYEVDSEGNIIVLNLSNNQISEIKGLEKLNNLSILYLYSNQISDIKGLEKLNNLSKLYLDNNQISEIKELENLVKSPILKHISIANNPYFENNNIILEENENHKDILLNELSKLKNRRLIQYPLKICLLGNHHSGKTTFLNYFTNKRTPAKSTHILAIHPFRLNKKENKESFLDAVFFDFGGQDYYHGIYKAFLTDSSTNLIFWHKETDINETGKDYSRENETEAEAKTINFNRKYWLGQLEYAENVYGYKERKKNENINPENLPDLYQVQTFADMDTQDIYIHSDTRRYHYITLDKETLKKKSYKHALDSFKEELMEKIDSRKEEERSESEIKLYHFILENRNKANKLDISKLLKHYDKKKDEINLLQAELDQLSKKGMVLYYKNSDSLNNTVWINPSKTVEEIYDLFGKEELSNYKGKIPEKVLIEKIKDKDLIELLIHNKVIYFDQIESTYIIPSYLHSVADTNDEYFIFGNFNQYNFSLKFEKFIPFGFINQLICKYGNNPEKKSYRKDQLIFTTKEEKAKVLIRLDYQKLLIQVGVITNTENIKAREIEREIFFDLLATYWGIREYYYPEQPMDKERR
ncbi:MAG: leucine-rich repeat domain-containing protein [Prevotella sp.]|jgi:internalin A|nr:leucine-rich repeat domain-containing protein [Prevotella sp.]